MVNKTSAPNGSPKGRHNKKSGKANGAALKQRQQQQQLLSLPQSQPQPQPEQQPQQQPQPQQQQLLPLPQPQPQPQQQQQSVPLPLPQPQPQPQQLLPLPRPQPQSQPQPKPQPQQQQLLPVPLPLPLPQPPPQPQPQPGNLSSAQQKQLLPLPLPQPQSQPQQQQPLPLPPLPLPSPQPQSQPEQQQPRPQPHHTTPPVQEAKASSAFNPVGELQEHCQKYLWPLPSYAFKCTGANDPARRDFACTVDVFGKRASATGQSKRMAKRRAAATLLSHLRVNCDDKVAAPAVADAPAEAPAEALPIDEATFQKLRVSKRLQSASRAGAEIGGLFCGLRNRKAGAVLPPLEAPSATASAFEQLTELGRTHRFGIAFVTDDASSPCSAAKAGQQQHRSIVKLSTMPTIVAIGYGSDANGAREEACRAAMEYLCMLTKESQIKQQTAVVVADGK